MANSNNSNERKKVIVIGAGFSGLAVAYDLAENQHFDVQILEGRDRIGGRVHPYNLDGTTIDLGGQWVHESSRRNPIRKLMEELDIPFQSGSGDKAPEETEEKKGRKKRQTIVFDKGGKLINKATIKSASKMFYKALNEYNERKVDVDTSMQDLLDRAMPSTEEGEFATEDFKQVVNYLCHRTEVYEGGRLHELSVYLDEIYHNLGGPDEIPQGGYNTVLNALASKIGDSKIRLGCIVESIDYETNVIDGKVAITLAGGECVEGDYCVCTAPLGVLQHRKIQFSPQLPVTRWEAIDAIGMGLLDKIALKFDAPFWGYGYFGASDSDPALVKNFYDCSDDVGAPVLFAFLGGDAARRVDSPTGLSDEEAVSETMEQLRTIFGDGVPDPVATRVTRWNVDPFALGSYSYAKVGSTEGAYDEVASPVGNLLFAGEHTSKRAHSNVHGAWATGQREARRLSKWISVSSK